MLRPVVLILFFLSTAAAQVVGGGLTCATNVSVTPTLRSEGYAEPIGDVTFTCTGGTPTAQGSPVPSANIQFLLNTAATNRTYPSGFSDALAIVNEPNSGLFGASAVQLPCTDPSGLCTVIGTASGPGPYAATYDGSAGHPNIFYVAVSGNSVTFTGIPLDAPGSGGKVLVLRFTNIRVNATTLRASGPAVSVIASISVSGSTTLLVTNPTPTVGFVQDSLSVATRSPDNTSAGGSTTISSCSTPQRAGVIRFSELFTTAFRRRTEAAFVDADTSPAPVVENFPGYINNSESGFNNPALSSPAVDFATVGIANYGTRLRAHLGRPTGTRVWVSVRNVAFSGGNPVLPSSGPVARMVTDARGAFSPVVASTTLEGIPAFEIDGSAVTWEVLKDVFGGMESLDFVVWVQGGSAVEQGAFSATYAPAPEIYTDIPLFGAASSSLPLPRFASISPLAGLYTTAGGCPAPSATTTTLSAAMVNPSSPVTLTATVTSGGGTPAGDVYFFDSAAPPGAVASAHLVNGIGSVVLTPAVGPHTYTAYFAGGGMYAESTSQGVTVNALSQTGATIVVTSSTSPASVGQSVTFTATVSGSGATPTGSVAFFEGSQALGTVNMSAGRATLTTSFATVGAHTITALYGGDSNYFAVNAAFSQIINALAPVITLSGNPLSATVGQSVTLTAQLSPPPSGAPAATGTIQFLDGNVALGSAAIVNGGAAFSTTALSAGPHTLTAAYSGDGNWAAARSAAITVTIQAPTRKSASISLSSSNSPSVVGQSVTFTASVSAESGTPTGSVRFADGDQTLGSAGLAGGQASFTTSFTGARTHDIFAYYGGDGGYSDVSARIGQMVVAVTPTISLAASRATVTTAEPITLTAQFSAAPSGAPAASGSVQFLDGTVSLGSATVANGGATLVAGKLAAGSHRILAAYSGDSNWYSARSQAVTVTVTPAASSTVLTVSFTSTRTDLTASVGGEGTVQFVDDTAGTVLGDSRVYGGVAGLTMAALDTLALAGHSVTARYSGSESLLASRSNPVVLTAMINSAGNLSASFAPEELTTIFGAGLGQSTQTAAQNRLPETLGGVIVSVADSAGQTRNAGLFYVSPARVNFVVPAGMPPGAATFTLYRGGAAVFTTQAEIAPVAPGIFTISGAAATQVVRAGENSYLTIYGTGIRNRTSLAAVSCLLDGQETTVLYAGAQSDFAGLDQVNVQIPDGMTGAVSVELVVDGRRSNTATVVLR